MDTPPSLARFQKFDVNNVVRHGKGFSVLSALETALGGELFNKIYRQIIANYGGKRLGWRVFQQICETESGQDLGWFFEDWVRSSKPLNYWIQSQNSTPKDGGFISEIRVMHGINSIRMPVPVHAVFEDGTSQMQWTNRFSKLDVLRFQSRSKLKTAKIDPEHRLAVIEGPLRIPPEELAELIDKLDWTGTAETAFDLYQRPESGEIQSHSTWFKMGVLLFDGWHLSQSFGAFKKCQELDPSNENQFRALAWMGIIKDLTGERNNALAYYREALKHDTGKTLRQDQYGLIINRTWIEERLKSPFIWKNKEHP